MKKRNIMVLGALFGGVAGIAGTSLLQYRHRKVPTSSSKDKFRLYYNTLNQWLILKQKNRNLSEYFKEKNYSRIAIYGLGELGNRLIEELMDTEIEVAYGVDKNIDNTFCGINAYTLEDIDNASKDIDVFVVTPIFAFDEVSDMLRGKVNCDIVSLEDIIFEM